MRIHHLDCGSMCPPAARLVNGQGSLLQRGKLVCHVLLIESSAGLVLVDTGLGANAIRDPKRWLHTGFLAAAAPTLRPEETALHQIERLGLSAKDVRHIVVTHLDLDHAGGLADFPDAEVHVFAPEHDAAMQRATLQEKNRYRPIHWAHRPKWHTHEIPRGERWQGFSAVRAIADTDDEILIVPVTGHSRGHSAVAIKRPDGKWLLHCGDAYFYHGEIAQEPPDCPPGLRLFQTVVAFDNADRLANQARLRRLAKDTPGQIELFCSHDPTELARY